MAMQSFVMLAEVGIIGLITTSSVMLGAALGLYYNFPGKLLAGILAFASGSLIAALAIELGFENAEDLIRHGASVNTAFFYIAGGFMAGAIIYSVAALFLEQKGAALRYPTLFMQYALKRKRQQANRLLAVIGKSEVLRRLPPEQMAALIDDVYRHDLLAGDVVFQAGDAGDAIYLVASGTVEVLSRKDGHLIAELGEGQIFGEMALMTAQRRTATVRAKTDCSVYRLSKEDFQVLLKENPFLERAFRKLIQQRVAENLQATGHAPGVWTHIANENIRHVTHAEEFDLMHEASKGKGAGLAIVFGNILDTIPGCLVIGANFVSFETVSLTLILGMFLGGVPEAAASATMLRRAGFGNRTIFLLWSTVLVAGVVAAVLGKLLLSNPSSAYAVVAQAVAGGAILALITHAMIPEALHKGGNTIVLPAVAGFLVGLYFALLEGMTHGG